MAPPTEQSRRVRSSTRQWTKFSNRPSRPGYSEPLSSEDTVKYDTSAIA